MQTPDPGEHKRLIRRCKGCAILAIIFFITCFIRIPMGNFFIWIPIGLTAYFVFLAVYFLVLAEKSRHPFRKKKLTKQEIETRAYVSYHVPILISVLLGGLLVALAIWLFLT
jgi:hypothetical protein